MWYYWEKLTSYEKFSYNLTFEVKIVYKISVFQVSILLMKVSKYWKIVEFQKISIKMKNCKTFYETQTASCLKEIIQPPQPPIPPDKILIRLWNKNFLERYTEIYRYLLSKCFKKVVLGRQEMVQCKCFFLHQTETCLLENL